MASDHWFILRNRLASHLRIAAVSVLFIAAAAMAFIAVRPVLPIRPTAKTPALFHPAVAEWQFLGSDTTPPTEAACYAAGIRCFTPTSMENAYNVTPLYAQGFTGRGKTIAVIDSFGSATIANDLNVFSTQFGLPHLCGEAGVTCTTGMPTFTILEV